MAKRQEFEGDRLAYLRQQREEQTEAQISKVKIRPLNLYDGMVLRRKRREDGLAADEVGRYVDNYCGREIGGFEELLKFMVDRKGGGVVWADMGGGVGVALRQIKCTPSLGDLVETINVDLFDRSLDDDFFDARRDHPEYFVSEASPMLIEDNAETVCLPVKADLITSMMSIPYLNHPLAAMANWYNQLADGGLMVVAGPHGWIMSVNCHQNGKKVEGGPMWEMFKVLTKEKVGWAVNTQEREEDVLQIRFGVVIIEKMAKTRMVAKVSPTRIKVGQNFFKEIEYGEYRGDPVEVVRGEGGERVDLEFDYELMKRLMNEKGVGISERLRGRRDGG